MSETSPYELRIACWRKGANRAEKSASLEDAEGSVFSWVDVLSKDKEATATLLIEEFGFHELEVEDALTEGERPHLHENDAHLFFTAPAVRVEGDDLELRTILI